MYVNSSPNLSFKVDIKWHQPLLHLYIITTYDTLDTW